MVKKRARRHRSLSDRVFSFVVWSILVFTLIIVIIPAMHIFAGSFSSASELMKGIYLLPRDISLKGYEAVFKNEKIVGGYINTIIYTIVGTLVNTIFTIMAAYPLSRRKLAGRNTIMFIFAFTMLFNGGLIPTYITVTKIGLTDTFWALVLVNAVNVWLMIVARTFFEATIPVELYESASMDGCTDFQALFKIVLPLSKAIIAVCVLMYAIGYWNGYFDALVYIRAEDKMPLQVVLRNILLSTVLSPDLIQTMGAEKYADLQKLQYVLKYSCIVVATVPMLCFYPFIQKYFVKGMMVGAVKG